VVAGFWKQTAFRFGIKIGGTEPAVEIPF